MKKKLIVCAFITTTLAAWISVASASSGACYGSSSYVVILNDTGQNMTINTIGGPGMQNVTNNLTLKPNTSWGGSGNFQSVTSTNCAPGPTPENNCQIQLTNVIVGNPNAPTCTLTMQVNYYNANGSKGGCAVVPGSLKPIPATQGGTQCPVSAFANNSGTGIGETDLGIRIDSPGT